MNPMLALLGQPEVPIPMRQPWQTPGINPTGNQPRMTIAEQAAKPGFNEQFTGLLGNPMFRVGLSLLGTKDKRNAVQNALGGLQGASEFQQQQQLADMQRKKYEAEMRKAEREDEKYGRTREALEAAAQQAEAAGNPTAAALLRSEATAATGASMLGKGPSDLQEKLKLLKTDPEAARALGVVEPPETGEWKQIGDTGLMMNDVTGDTRPIEGFGAAGSPQLKPTDISSMRKEYTKRSEDFTKIRDAYAKIQKAAANPSPAGDMALIFGYMKILDPGSTVREGEYASAKNAGSVPARVRAAYNNALKGDGLAPSQRTDFLAQAGNTFQAQLETQRRLEQEYQALAGRWGARPEDIVGDIMGPYRNFGLGGDGGDEAAGGQVPPPSGGAAIPGGGLVTPEAIRAERERRQAQKRRGGNR